jgi:hypothetical protein
MDRGWIGRVLERERLMRRERLFGDGSEWKATAFAIVAVVVLFFDWGLGAFLFADYHCGGPDCRAMEAALNLSAVSAFIGLGCVVLTALVDGRRATGFAFRPGLLLAAAAGVCGFVALASLAVRATPFLGLLLFLFPFPLIAMLLLLFSVWVLVWKSGW